jgi:hypothetical protein
VALRAADVTPEGLETAHPQFDVEPVGQLGPHAAGCLARRAGTPGVAFHEDHVAHTDLGEVEGDADAHDAAAGPP